MKIHLKEKYYKRSKVGREPIRFHVRQPKGAGTDVHGTIWLDPVLRERQNADLRKDLLKHETDEIRDWAKGKKGSHTRAKSQEPALIRNIGGVSGFWREIARRNRREPMERVIPSEFDPKTMKRDKGDSKIVYVSTLAIGESVALPETGHILIGVKDKPSKKKIAEVIRHEKSHLGHRTSILTTMTGGARDYLVIARRELQGYSKERKTSSPTEWNKVLPGRIKQFMGYLTWVTKADQKNIKAQAKQILSPKKGGGNEKAVCQAQADLAQWWLEEEKPPTKCQAVVVKRSIDDITRELSRGAGVAKPQPIKPGVGYTKGDRLSRSHRKGFKKVKYT